MQVDAQIIRWRRRRRKEARKKKNKEEFMQYAVNRLGGKLEALRWLKDTYLPQYRVSAATLFKRGNTKALKWKLDKDENSSTTEV